MDFHFTEPTIPQKEEEVKCVYRGDYEDTEENNAEEDKTGIIGSILSRIKKIAQKRKE